MTEAVVVVNDYWFDVLGFPVPRVPKAVANEASRRISEKTDMRLVTTFEGDYVSGRLSAQIWEITAEDWRAKRTEFNFERSAIHGRATINVRSGNVRSGNVRSGGSLF